MTTSGSVLIVEDDMALRQGLRNTLEAAGFCPREASSGEEAFLALHHNQFETILLDINMHGIGGMEACRRIRQMYPLLPILMLTQYVMKKGIRSKLWMRELTTISPSLSSFWS